MAELGSRACFTCLPSAGEGWAVGCLDHQPCPLGVGAGAELRVFCLASVRHLVTGLHG